MGKARPEYSRLDVAKRAPPFMEGCKKMLFGNRLYLLLATVPIALLAEPLGMEAGLAFSLSCIAILPLAGLLGEATEQVAIHTNETLSGLLNATFGNATELIVCIFALRKGLLTVIQVSLLGSILSNTLLVLGCACVAGGMVKSRTTFNKVAAVEGAILLQLAILGLVVPTVLVNVGEMKVGAVDELQLSRIISLFLFVLYFFYLYFQLFSHRTLFEDTSKNGEGDDEDEEEEEVLSLKGGLAILCIATVLIAIISETLTATLNDAAKSWGLGSSFVGFVILPIVGNAAEHSTAIIMAAKSKMDLAFGVALGSSTQIALFVVPVMVILAWINDQPLDLYFGTFPTVITFLSSLVVFFVVQNGETNWLEGVMLLFAYLIICTSFFYYDADAATSSLK